ncbi:helicase associated domain-containing protein [Streptomyces sp. KL116D]|uniref:helicase associated domain-containing protein n=1 Tax=Streptomyces sp. KL116D TaxID=3045152 RepID=UPI0035574983
MVWNAHGHAFDEGLAVARAWAEEHGHLLAPVSAVSEGGFPIGVWLKNQRRGRRRQAVEAAAAHEQGQRVPRAGWGLSQSRLDALDAIDSGWCPAWDTAWQRCYRLAKNHLDAGGILPQCGAGVLVVQGEDLGGVGAGAAAGVGQARARAAVAARIGPRPRVRPARTSGRCDAPRTTSGC